MSYKTPMCQNSPGEPHPRCGKDCDQPMMLPVDKPNTKGTTMYGIDESKANTTYADGFGRFCAIVTATNKESDDRMKARKLIREALDNRGYHLGFDIALVRITEHGTSIYSEI